MAPRRPRHTRRRSGTRPTDRGWSGLVGVGRGRSGLVGVGQGRSGSVGSGDRGSGEAGRGVRKQAATPTLFKIFHRNQNNIFFQNKRHNSIHYPRCSARYRLVHLLAGRARPSFHTNPLPSVRLPGRGLYAVHVLCRVCNRGRRRTLGSDTNLSVEGVTADAEG